MHLSLIAAAAAAVFALDLPSEAPTIRADLPAFGLKRQLVVQGASGAAVLGRHTQFTEPGRTYRNDVFEVSLSPSIGTFVADNLLIGGFVDFNALTGGGDYTLGIAVGPYIGYRLAAGQGLSLLPTLGVGYKFNRSHFDATDTTEADNVDSQLIYARAHVDLVVPLRPHLSMTVGPFVHQSLFNHSGDAINPWYTNYGAQLGLLGWF